MEPICGSDLAEVGAFLHDHLNSRLSAGQWSAAIVPTWQDCSPNHGFLLRQQGRVVGVQLAFYSQRPVEGRQASFCNLGAWCVLEEFRSHGFRLLRAALAQRGYHFTDLSPSGNVVPLNRKLGFESLDTATALVPHRPLGRSRGVRVVSDHARIEKQLSGRDLEIFRDHRHAAAAIHLVLVRGDEHCYVVARRDRRKELPVFASLLHIGNPEMFNKHLSTFGRHLLYRRGLLCSLVEVRLLGRQPASAYRVPAPRPKMFRSCRGTALPADAVDNLYSELALVAW